MNIPLSLYIHIPWCIKKCPYCDFNSHALNNTLPEAQYLQALIEDLQADLELVQGRTIETIFFGGGTPSLISPSGIANLLNNLQKHVKFAPNIEITLETNPGTIEHHSFADYKLAGINRISLGAQSFDDHKLSLLGRIHKSDETLHAVDKLHQINFRSFNIDLMHGLPQQTVDEALRDLETAISCAAPHISWYQLTIEPNTVFYKYPPKLPQDDITWEIQCRGEELLRQHGFTHYEVSAFAKPGQECLHNLNYWEFGDYIGIGAGAHGKITKANTLEITRTWKTRNPKDYLDPAQNFLAGSSIIDKAQVHGEYMLNRLRLFKPVLLQEITARTGQDFVQIKEQLTQAQAKELITIQNELLTLTPLGKRFLNDVLHIFL